MSTTLKSREWDMSVIYPGLDSPEFDAAFASLSSQISDLAELFERNGIERQDAPTVDAATVEKFEDVTRRFNGLLALLVTVRAYIHSFITTDSRNNQAQARMSELQLQFVLLSKLDVRFTAWIGSLDVEELTKRSQVAREHAFMLRKAHLEAEHLMEPRLEDLAAELEVTGSSAWSKLHGTLTSQITVPLEVDGKVQDLPMTVIRNFAYSEDREERRRAFEAELEAWKRVQVPLAAALNSLKGETNTLQGRRGWESPLDAACFGNNIDRPTLDAMMEAARASFPDFRRYLKAKARALGIETLAWYDVFAPVGKSSSEWDYETGARFLVEQFGSYSSRLSDFAANAIEQAWIDVDSREGKVGGAFCMGVRRGESRVLLNYVPSYDGISTLAHELGHAYHNFNLGDRTPLQRGTPMTLAETASIFCETIIRHAAMQRADEQEQLAILEAAIQSACQVVVDISSRFMFEQGVFERRKQRELSVDEFCELMLQTQRDTYGDGLDGDTLHPYMWAVKGHYYGPTFYNFPYMFGLLFGLGLYAQYQHDPERFKAGYDELLSSTGLDDAATLAQRFGIDVRTPEFWHSSLDILRADIDRFEELVDASVGR
jgi:oligoendopeptidase F